MAARAEDRFGRRAMNVVPTGTSSLRSDNHILTHAVDGGAVASYDHRPAAPARPFSVKSGAFSSSRWISFGFSGT
jgi:hypothetical protein